jgi:hypothetical protein
VARLWREDIWAFFSRDQAKHSSCFWRVRRTRSRNLGQGFGICSSAALSWLHTPPVYLPALARRRTETLDRRLFGSLAEAPEGPEGARAQPLARVLYNLRVKLCARACLAAVLLLSLDTLTWPESVSQLQPTGYVNDFAHVLDPATTAQINDMCQQIDAKAHAQIVLVTINSLDGSDVETFAVDLFKRWGIGSKSTDRGVLILYAIQDHRARVEVGYGCWSQAALPRSSQRMPESSSRAISRALQLNPRAHPEVVYRSARSFCLLSLY